MPLTPEELAARYDRPYRKAERVEISDERFEKGLRRGDDGAWGVGALVMEGRRVLFVRENETWLLPGGRLEPGEEPRGGAKREVKEETGHGVTVTGLGAIAEQTFIREGTDECYEFYFATFLAEPRGPGGTDAEPADRSIDEVAWRRNVPSNTFDRELVVRLVETYV